MRNASLIDSPTHGNAVRRAQPATDAASPPFIILTSVFIETQRPTWVFTETVAGSTVTTTVQLETVQSDSGYTQPAQSKTTRLDTVTLASTQTANVQPVTPTASSPTTTPTQSIEEWAASSSSSLSALHVHTRTHDSSGGISLSASSPSTSSPSTRSTGSSSWPKPGVQQITTTSSFPSPSRSSSPVTSSPTTSSPGAGIFSGATAEKSSDEPKGSSHKVGTIVGSAVGSAAFVALILLACFFLFRRRRRVIQHQRQHSRQRLLRDSDSIMSFNGMDQSQPPLPILRAPLMPPAPALSQQRQSNPPQVRPSLALAVSNQDLSLDRMYLRKEDRHPDDSFADPEKSPVSPIIHISPPSRSASNYSRASWEDDWRALDYYDASSRNSLYENTYYHPSGGASLLPNDSRQVSCIDTPRSRDSRRSNPFDLEPPPNALQKWPALSFTSAPGAVNF